MRLILILTTLLLLAVPAWAVGPVNPTTVEADLPQTNADGTNLTDLASARFCAGLSGSPVLSNCVTVPVTTLDPPTGAKVSSPIAAFNLTVDGQYEVDADAVDTAGNRGAKSARAPFEWNRQSPAALSTPRFP